MNIDQVIMSCDEGKRDFGELQKYVDQKTKEGEALNNDVNTLKNQLAIQGTKLTDEARADLEEQLEKKSTQLQRFQQDTQGQVDNRRTRIANRIAKKAQPLIEKASKEKGLSFVLYLNQSLVAWVDPSIIITGEIIKAYNAAYPVAPQVKKPQHSARQRGALWQ